MSEPSNKWPPKNIEELEDRVPDLREWNDAHPDLAVKVKELLQSYFDSQKDDK